METENSRCAKAKRSIPMRRVVIRSFSIFSVLSFTLLATVSIWLVNMVARESLEMNARQDYNVARQEIESCLAETAAVVDSIVRSDQIIEFANWMNANSDRQASDFPKCAALKRSIDNVFQYNSWIYAVGIYALDSQRCYYSGRLSMRSIYDGMDLEPDFEALASKDTSWSNLMNLQYTNNDVFLLQKIMIDPDRIQVVGALTVIVECRNLRLAMKGIESMLGNSIILRCGDRLIAWDKNYNRKSIADTKLTSLEDEASRFSMLGQRGESVISGNLSNGWQLISISDGAYVSEQANNTALILWGICLAALFLSIFLSRLLSRQIAQPIIELADRVHRINIDSNRLKVKNDHRFSETETLSRSINEMLDRINELLLKVYEQRIRERDTRIEMLQAQINPHFLYNVLDSIHARLFLKGDETTDTMVVALADIMRYSLSNASQKQQLSEELKYVYRYLYLQSQRIGSKLKYEIEIGAEEEKICVPKLIIQPFVENAIQHGFSDVMPFFLIKISATITGGRLYIRIDDNGKGFDESLIHDLLRNESVLENESGHMHIGIRNVYNRILLTYGENNCSVAIHSRIGKGTSVALDLPID